MKTYTSEQLKEILEKHKEWIEDNSKGERADLRSADLRAANLRSANLSWANLSSADLRAANLSWANLSSADLSSADLRSADLRAANLRSANLSWANLSSADLSWARTDKRYIQINCIGSRKGSTTYCFEDDKILCGCFSGKMEDFVKRVKETYPDKKNIYRREYDAFITMIRLLKEKK